MMCEQEQKLNLLAADSVYVELMAQCGELEDAYRQIKDNLAQEDREILERYIALCEEMDYRKLRLALDMGR